MLSKETYFYGCLLVISSSFTFQIYKFFEIILGENVIKSIIHTTFILVAILLIIYEIKIEPHIIQIFYLALAFLLSFILITILPFLAEKTHILSYGLLGYLSTNDLFKKRHSTLKSILLALIFGLIINVLDEIFQGILPYRTGELRDIMTNIVCTIIGILIFLGFNKKGFSKI